MDSTFIAERSAHHMLTRNTVVSAGKLMVVVLAAYAIARDVLAIIGAWASAAVLGVVVAAGLLHHRVGAIRRPSRSELLRSARRLRSRLISNQLSGIGTQIPWYVVPLLVTARLSATENAYFYVTWMMCAVFLVISPAVSTSLLAEGVHAPSELRSKAWRTIVIISALLVPCMVAFLLVGGDILSTFGSVYESHGVALMQLVVFTAIPDAVTNVYVAVLRVEQRLVSVAWLNLTMGGFTLGLSFLLLPLLGITAVGWSWLAAQVGGSVFVAMDLSRRRWAARHHRQPG